ncbi:MAG TPA: 2-phospho-L-lactate transferase CofD family protein [Roseiflexaceae bacterium]|nr:2-phospho-L-lactate transferase CofD family protein [Roseiflexaceae bacterium]
MQQILNRLSSLSYLARPLALAFVGIFFLSLGATYFVIEIYRNTALPPMFYYLTLQFLDRSVRGAIFAILGLAILLAGIWQLSGVVVIPLTARPESDDELVIGYRRATKPPKIAVLSGGAGLLILASLGRYAARLTCITPVQDPVEYYYRASSLYHFENVIFVPPIPAQLQVEVELDDGTRHNVKDNISHDDRLAARHVVDSFLVGGNDNRVASEQSRIFRQALEAIEQADAIILGPGSLFESILPNLLIPDVREAVQRSKARTIYICSLMTEPGMTSGFGVADHIRQFVRYGGFAPDYVLVNAQRIDPDVRQMYEAANQSPVYLNPEDYEETIVSATDRVTARDVLIEGSVVIEADLASSVVQLTASLDHPGEGRTVRVLRHDPDKLAAAILEILRRE